MYPWVRQVGFQGAFVQSVDSGPSQAHVLQEGSADVPDTYLQFVVLPSHIQNWLRIDANGWK